ncbi:hypothetical protein [Paenibacillus sp. VTT E-133280]|uniref:hypothetical protein n=1 Tax=Paenibacillus sp. VTT E-133280 TaxID=1986222 RepID=UPI00117E56A8|nr:hypothetical protein [Paenibacillus sp. VTT E-133280]
MSQISHESYVFATPEAAIGGIATLCRMAMKLSWTSARRLGLKVLEENEAKRRITRQAPKLYNDKS